MNDEKKNASEDVNSDIPKLHTIPYPEKYQSHLNDDGASAFRGMADHVNSRYYVFNMSVQRLKT